MIISMKLHASKDEVAQVRARIEEFGYKVHSIEGEERVVIGAVGVGDVTACLESIEAMPCVERAVRISAPYKFVSREFRRAKTEIAFPICAEAKQFGEMPVLKVGYPGYAGKGKPPAIKLCTLEENVDPVFAECVRRGQIATGAKRLEKALLSARVVKGGSTNDLQPRDRGKRRNIRRHRICTDKQHHLHPVLRMCG